MTAQHRSSTAKLLLPALLAGFGALGANASDVPAPSQFISEVIPIKYERASDLAAALTKMTTNSVSTTTETGGPGAVIRPGTPLSTNADASSSTRNGFDQRVQNILRAAAVLGELKYLGPSHIISDERTNSLLIYAAPQDMQTFKEIISLLDHPLPLLLVEVVVFDFALGDSDSLSSSLTRGNTEGPNNYSLGASLFGGSNLFFVTDLMPMPATNTAGVQAIGSNHPAKSAKDAKEANRTSQPKASHHAGFAYLARVGSDLDALVRALANDSRVRILQRPRIQTSDGEPATIFVGESRPYPTSSYYSDYSGGASGPSSIQQLQVGITLEVTPFVKPEGSVEIGIRQRLDQFAGTVTIQNVGDVPITTSSEAQASLMVHDRETLLLGGWIQALKDQTHSGVPLLKDIPLLGPLFRTSSARAPRHELIVLIRPTILPSQEATTLSAKATHADEAEPNR